MEDNVGGGVDTTMLNALVPVCTGIVESVTRTVKLKVPAAVGVPEITPVPALSDRPVGNEPLARDQVYGGVPPEAASVAVYEAFSVPPGKDDVVTESGAACTVRLVLPVTPLNVAVMVVPPAATAVARPALLMLATPVLEEDHVTWLVKFCVLASE